MVVEASVSLSFSFSVCVCEFHFLQIKKINIRMYCFFCAKAITFDTRQKNKMFHLFRNLIAIDAESFVV